LRSHETKSTLNIPLSTLFVMRTSYIMNSFVKHLTNQAIIAANVNNKKRGVQHPPSSTP
jgi:hypothetical protein